MFVHRDGSGRIIDVTGSVNRAELERLLAEQDAAEKQVKKEAAAEARAEARAEAKKEAVSEAKVQAAKPVYGETHPPEAGQQATKRKGS